MQHRRTFSFPAITYAHRSLLIEAGQPRGFSMKTFLKQLLAALVVLSMVGCTTIQPLSVNASELSHTLKKGDKVEVVTSKGQQLNFKVDSVDDTGLQGAGQRVAYNDIQSISRKETDTKTTTLVVLGVLAAGAIAAAAGGGGGGGGNGY
jgi:predicted small lipoprotein YifL